ncbi:hypothetical protein [Streptomyces sodiiphilus]
MKQNQTEDFHVGSAFPEEEPDILFAGEVRVTCPECAQSIALATADDALPQHALCPTRWDPFGLTVCPGSGRTVAADGGLVPHVTQESLETIPLVALPETLDWRLQPFSHVGGAGARPIRLRQAA